MDTTTHRVIVDNVASVFIANTGSDTVSVLDGKTDRVLRVILVGQRPIAVVVAAEPMA